MLSVTVPWVVFFSRRRSARPQATPMTSVNKLTGFGAVVETASTFSVRSAESVSIFSKDISREIQVKFVGFLLSERSFNPLGI